MKRYCPVCGKLCNWVPLLGWSKYCSDTCREHVKNKDDKKPLLKRS